MEQCRGSASSPATGMAVENTIEGLYISIFGVDGPQHDSEARSARHQLKMEESRGIASSPATGMAEEPEEMAHEALRNPSDLEWFISTFGVDGQQPDQGEKWFFSILDGQKPDPEASSKHRIPKAPTKFREYEEDKKYFDPRVVSLGPYHHGEDHLKPMEKHKIMAAKQFVDEFISQNGGRGTIYKKFMDLTRELTECYDADEVTTMNDHVFARMMFLDGCFILHFIQNFKGGKFNEGEKTKLEISNNQIPLIIRDMFLIENQLPFEVLDALMSLLWGSSSLGKNRILEFINLEVLIPMGMFYPVNSYRPVNWCRAHDSRPLHLLDILRTVLLDFRWTKKEMYRLHNFGSVMELKEIGIRFRFERRSIKRVMGISFKENFLFTQLSLPKLAINDTTISRLLNLTALEACYDTYSGCGVTSFIHFMDTLINDDADVKMLRSKGILHHSLGSDEEMARLFNTWPADKTNDLQLYSDIRSRIRGHRDRKVMVSIATWVDKYFGSPWTAISLVAAVVLLVFTAIQTYLAAFPRG